MKGHAFTIRIVTEAIFIPIISVTDDVNDVNDEELDLQTGMIDWTNNSRFRNYCRCIETR